MFKSNLIYYIQSTNTSLSDISFQRTTGKYLKKKKNLFKKNQV